MKTEMAYQMEVSFVSYCSAGKKVVIMGRALEHRLTFIRCQCAHTQGRAPILQNVHVVTPKPVFNTILKRA